MTTQSANSRVSAAVLKKSDTFDLHAFCTQSMDTTNTSPCTINKPKSNHSMNTQTTEVKVNRQGTQKRQFIRLVSHRMHLIPSAHNLGGLTIMLCAMLPGHCLATQPWGTALGSFNGIVNYSDDPATMRVRSLDTI